MKKQTLGLLIMSIPISIQLLGVYKDDGLEGLLWGMAYVVVVIVCLATGFRLLTGDD